MNKKLNTLKLIALSSLIFLGTVTYNNNYKATAQQNNTTTVDTVENQQSNTELATAEIEGYKGAVQSCNRSGKFVTCDVLITSTKKDNEVTLYAWPRLGGLTPSRIIDLDGNEYVASSIKSGTKENDRYINVDLIQGVPDKVIVTFAKVPLEVNKLAVMELNGRRLKLQFRDFAISNNR